MADSEKNEALKQKIEELEEQAGGEQQEATTWLEKLKRQHEVTAFEDRQLQDQELQILNVNYSNLQHQYKSLLQRHTLLLGVFTDVKSATFDEYISSEANKIAQNQIEDIREETKHKMEALESKIKELLAERASVKENNASLSNVTSIKLEEIGKLEALVNSLTTDAKRSSAKIQELEEAGDSLNKALQSSTQSLSTSIKVLQKAQSEYDVEKKRFENERNGFRNEIMMSIKKLKKEEEEKEAQRKEEEEIRRNKEEEDNLTEEEKRVRRSVQPRNNTQREGTLSAVFKPFTCKQSLCRYMVQTGPACYMSGLDINKYNVLAVAYDGSVYIYSEANKREEKLCTYQYVRCLAWDEQGTLLAINGRHSDHRTITIQVWDIPNRKIVKVLKRKDEDYGYGHLSWKGDTITTGGEKYSYQWNIKDQDNDQDDQGNKALLPKKTIQNKDFTHITAVQWSNCKSKLATITKFGYMCIYDEELELIQEKESCHDCSSPRLQWCPWDNQIIATYGKDGRLKIWRVQQDITLIKEVGPGSSITDMKWIPSKKAIITAVDSRKLTLWEYPNLSIILTMNGHIFVPKCLALNADKSAMVSISNREMIFWKPFDQF